MSKWRFEYNARLKQVWPTDMTEVAMAEEFGVTPATVSIRAAGLGLPSRIERRSDLRRSSHHRRDLLRMAMFGTVRNLDSRTAEYLASCAERRGWKMEQLLVTMLRVIACDKMTDAILDDADQLQKAG